MKTIKLIRHPKSKMIGYYNKDGTFVRYRTKKRQMHSMWINVYNELCDTLFSRKEVKK